MRNLLKPVISCAVWLCAILLFCFAGCTASPAQPAITAKYGTLLKTLTKKSQLYNGLDTVLLISATYQDWSLRQAYVQKYAADHSLTPAEKQKLLTEQNQAQVEGYEFIVGTFTDNKKWDNLDKADSIWSLYLENDKGIRLKPLSIDPQPQTSIYISTYYPNYSPWKKIYKILFPITSPDDTTPLITKQTKYITLEFYSTMGQVSLRWDL